MALEEEVEGHNGTEVVTSTENLISEVETGVIATPEQHHYIERLKDLQNEVVEGTLDKVSYRFKTFVNIYFCALRQHKT